MRKHTIIWMLFSVFCFSSTACVKKSTYRKMRSELEGEIADREKKIVSLQTALNEAEQRAATLDKQLIATKQELENTRAELSVAAAERERLSGELTAVVKDRARLKASAEELKRALAELGRRKAEAEKRVSQFRNLLARFKSLIDAGKLRVKIVNGRMVLALPTDVLFASGRAKLSDVGKVAIQEVATILATISGRRYLVEGHTDNVPIKTSRFPSNWELAAARSIVVTKAMIEAGMGGDTVSAASFGEYRPVGGNDTEAGRAANRRIEIVLVPDLSSLPGFDELNNAVGSR